MNDVLSVQSVQLEEEEAWKLVRSSGGCNRRHLRDEGEGRGRPDPRCIGQMPTRWRISGSRSCSAHRSSPPSIAQGSRQRITELAGDLAKDLIDEQRLAMEVAIFADKCAIDEEIVRLSSHIGQLRSTLAEDQAVGKKLDFILQEMNREINTIGSKANDITITKCVVEMKTELEKIREQIQNIE